MSLSLRNRFFLAAGDCDGEPGDEPGGELGGGTGEEDEAAFVASPEGGPVSEPNRVRHSQEKTMKGARLMGGEADRARGELLSYFAHVVSVISFPDFTFNFTIVSIAVNRSYLLICVQSYFVVQ